MTQLSEIATRHQAHVERLKSHEVKSFNSFLKDMQRDTLRLLHDDGEITEYTRKRLASKLVLIRQVLNQGIKDFKPEFDKIVLEFAEYESGFEKKSLESVVKTSFVQPSSTQVRTAVFNNPLQISGVDGGSLINAFYANQSKRSILATVNVLNMGYAQGKTNAQIGKELKDLGFAPLDRNMKSMIRTSMQHASNQSRQATWKANRNVVDKVKWSSTLDSRTCIAKGEKVNLHDGTTKNIEDVISGDEVISHLGMKRKVLASEKTGNREVIKVTFTNGKTLTATPDHKIFNDGEWVMLKDINSL